MKKIAGLFLSFILCLGLVCSAPGMMEAAKKPKISSKKITVNVGKSKKVFVRNIKAKKVKKVTWSSKNKKIVTVKKSGKLAAKIKAVKKGKTTVKVQVKTAAKVYRFSIKVTVKKASPVLSKKPVVTQNSMVTKTPLVPSTKPTTSPSEAPTSPSTEPSAVVPTESPSLAPSIEEKNKPEAVETEAATRVSNNFSETVGDFHSIGTSATAQIVEAGYGDSCLKVSGAFGERGEGIGVDLIEAGAKTGEWYEINAWVMMDEISNSGVAIKTKTTINKEDSNSIRSNTGQINAEETGTWKKLTTTVRIPSNCTSLIIYFAPFMEAEDFYLDEVAITSITERGKLSTLSYDALKTTYADYFKIGTAINGSANSNTTLRSPQMSEIIKKHFNTVTYSNMMKPVNILDKAGCTALAEDGKNSEVAVHFDNVTEGLEFCRENGIGMRGHVLVWHTQTPDWFFYEDYDTSKELVSKDVMKARQESYIKQVMQYCQTNYPGVIYTWDVVNEAIDGTNPDTSEGWNLRTQLNGETTLWYQTMGADYVKCAYQAARKYVQDETLTYNDFNTFDPSKTVEIVKMINWLNDGETLVDAVGMQSPLMCDNSWSSVSRMETAIRAFAETGVEIQITELTIKYGSGEVDEALQGSYLADLMERCLSLDTDNGGPANITAVTFFGLMDNYMMYDSDEQNNWLLDKYLAPKPTFLAMTEAVEKYLAIS